MSKRFLVMKWGDNRTAVERAVHAVRREDFLPAAQLAHAKEDAPLPIGFAQTISQPSLVEFMTRQLEVRPEMRVMEIGTGSGYQAAILAELARTVHTIERLRELAEPAHDRLTRLGYRNIHFRIGDGALGWPEAAPFDRIIATAAARTLPQAWIDQLAPGGRLVAPVGAHDDDQVLLLIEKDAAGAVTEHELSPVWFVPLVSETQR